MSKAGPSQGREPLRVGDGPGAGFEGLQERLRPLEGCAVEVEPVGHLAVGKRVGQPLSEPQLGRGDALAASAALRPTGGSGFDCVSHPWPGILPPE